jgi:hypothetical protein
VPTFSSALTTATNAPIDARGELRLTSSSSSLLAMKSFHRVSIDVCGDRLAQGVADLDGARIMHTAPDTRIVAI